MISAILCLGIACGTYSPQDINGVATWYDASRWSQSTWYTRKGIKMYIAAGPELRKRVPFRWKMKPYKVIVESLITHRKVVAYVVDWCQCYGGSARERLADFSPAIWRALHVPLGIGVMEVRIILP